MRFKFDIKIKKCLQLFKFFVSVFVFFVFFVSSVIAESENSCFLYGKVTRVFSRGGKQRSVIEYKNFNNENKYYSACYKDEVENKIYCYELLDAHVFYDSSSGGPFSNLLSKDVKIQVDNGAFICSRSKKVYSKNNNETLINFEKSLGEFNSDEFAEVNTRFLGWVPDFLPDVRFINKISTLVFVCSNEGKFELVAVSSNDEFDCSRLLLDELDKNIDSDNIIRFTVDNFQPDDKSQSNIKPQDWFLKAIPGQTCGVPGSSLNVCCDPKEVIDTQKVALVDNTYLRYIPGLRSSIKSTFEAAENLMLNILLDDYTSEMNNTNYPPYFFCGKNSLPVKSTEDISGNSSISYELISRREDLESCRCISKEEYRKSILKDDVDTFIDPNRVCKSTFFLEACYDEFNNCRNGIPTAVGCLKPDLNDFLKNFVFNIALGLAGIFSFLCITYAAFKINTSRGNVEEVNKAKAMINNCITGLLFIIFSIFILRFIYFFLFS